MDDKIETTEATTAEVTFVVYEQPTAGDIAKQALVATGVSLIGTALIYAAGYGVLTGIGALRKKAADRKEAKLLAKLQKETDTKS